ncbi:MAG: NAD(P)H-hydrate dehydratase [Victivallales bacterium]|nr:NAD(P)H-hydrate dehydratase [Victivallales bacterium]
MHIITVGEMKRLEAAAIEQRVSSLQLMENAGVGAARELLRFAEKPFFRRRCFFVLAGKGNNGGDAFVVARELANAGERVLLFQTSQPSEYLYPAADVLATVPPTVQRVEFLPPAPPPDAILVDGLLGTGLRGNATGMCAAAIHWVNNSGCPVVSLDIPSGLNGDTGEGDPAIHADLTLTMSRPKIGLFQENGPANTGIIRVIPIGLPHEVAASAVPVAEAFAIRDARLALTRRPADSHKNTFGHVLCIAGSRNYPGAPCLAAEAALRSGAGLVTLARPAAGATRAVPAAIITLSVGESDATHFQESHLPELEPTLARANTILIGPGIGPDVPPAFLQALLPRTQGLVLDADALRLLARVPELATPLIQRSIPAVLTPHPGEMQTLLQAFAPEAIKASRAEQARVLAAALRAVIVLKGHHTVVASPNGETSLNLTGNPALATAGTGDVLAGILAGLLAQQLPPYLAARLAVCVHGTAADLFPGAARSLIADDLLSLLPAAFAHISPLA